MILGKSPLFAGPLILHLYYKRFGLNDPKIITLPTKVHLAKAMVFPVFMYGCESWTVKKAECQKEVMLLNCGVGEDS